MARGESKWCTKNGIDYVKWKHTKMVHIHSVQSEHDIECKANAERQKFSTCGMPTISSQVHETNGQSQSFWQKSWTLLCQPQGKTVVDSYILLFDRHSCSQHLHFVPICSSRKSDVSRRSFPTHGVWTIVSVSFVKYRVCGKKRMKMMDVPDNIRLQQGNHFPVQFSTFRHCRVCFSRTNNNVHGSFAASAIVPCIGIFQKHWL